MSAEKSFVLTVDKNKKEETIKLFREFCLNDKEFSSFNEELFLNNSTICICLNKHIELEYYTLINRITQNIPNKYVFGLVTIWIHENAKYVKFELWPLTNSLFDVLNKSSELKRHFIEIIRKTNGYNFQIDNGDGSCDFIYSN